LLTDLVEIKRLGERKRTENEKLRMHLKRHTFVERRLLGIAKDMEDQVDCTKCANCCRVATVRLTTRDIERLAKLFKLSREKFLAAHTTEDPEEGIILNRTEAGCSFLSGNDCLIYEDRPTTCQDFPHLLKGGGSSLVARMWDMPDRATYCPIVYNALEEFKEETKFKDKSG
jgi:uncharacterized protein